METGMRVVAGTNELQKVVGKRERSSAHPTRSSAHPIPPRHVCKKKKRHEKRHEKERGIKGGLTTVGELFEKCERTEYWTLCSKALYAKHTRP